MKYFVKNCNERTIIPIDEFGSGTEPQIGGAIAEALLDRFNRNHSFGGNHDPLPEFEAFRRGYGGYRKRCHVVRPPFDAALVRFLSETRVARSP